MYKCSRCCFSMMVEWANDGILQADDGKMLVNDGEMLLMMVKWVYDHILISPSLTSISPSLTSILPSLACSISSFAHLTIIEKQHRLKCMYECNRYSKINKRGVSPTKNNLKKKKLNSLLYLYFTAKSNYK